MEGCTAKSPSSLRLSILSRASSKRHRARVLLFAPAGWIHGRSALQAALNSGFHTVFVDWHDPKIPSSSEYTFIKLPGTGYSKFKRVMSEAAATRLKDH